MCYYLSMFKKYLTNIEKNSTIAIYGTDYTALNIFNSIKNNRPDVDVIFVSDETNNNCIENKKVYSLYEIIGIKDLISLVVLVSDVKLFEIKEFLEYFNIAYKIPDKRDKIFFKVEKYIEKQKLALDVFANNKDKSLYDIQWDATCSGFYENCEQYAKNAHGISRYTLIRNYSKQYLEFINKNAIKNMIDGGFCNGINSFVFRREFKNLEKIYAYEPLYEKFKNKNYDSFIKNDSRIEIIPKCLWSCSCDIEFCENKNYNSASRVLGTKGVDFVKSFENKQVLPGVSIDDEKDRLSLPKIDFIKLDVEGSELDVLKGGLLTIKKDRPQMAVSIYHTIDDFVNIPLYLHEVLDDYIFHLGHYSYDLFETVIYAIPKELLTS